MKSLNTHTYTIHVVLKIFNNYFIVDVVLREEIYRRIWWSRRWCWCVNGAGGAVTVDGGGSSGVGFDDTRLDVSLLFFLDEDDAVDFGLFLFDPLIKASSSSSSKVSIGIVGVGGGVGLN